MPLNIVIIYGSVRTGRQGIKAARFAARELHERGHDVTLVDPVEMQVPLLDRMYKEYEKGKAPEVLENLATLYRAAVHLRVPLCEMGMPRISSMFPIPRVGDAFADDGTAIDPAMVRRFKKFATELEWYAEALRERRNCGTPY